MPIPSPERDGEPSPLKLVRKSVLAKQLDVSEWTLTRWVKARSFPAPFYPTDGSPAHWRVRDVENWIAQRYRSRRPRKAYQGTLIQQMAKAKARAQVDASVVRRHRRQQDATDAS
jgi:predicted DNA-binding transcriptional regulator AlpA